MISYDRHDTICAPATPAGGAIGIIRISGQQALSIADSLFRPARQYSSTHTLVQTKPQTLHYGEIIDSQGNVIDDVLVSIFRAPHSYTGEDSVEISCHGSRYIMGTLLRMLVDKGCRQAEPGEYTQRAYMNGKMDLSQAEAVADLIAATNTATHRIAISQMRGNISNELADLREQLLKMTSLLELELDFSDQDVSFADRASLLGLAELIDGKITRLADTFAAGKAIKDGIPVAIIGKTNVGKSTLLNCLLHDDKAIVSDIHGTTRDVIEDVTTIHGISFRFIDTAGLRQTEDEVERLGILRTYQKLDESTIIIWVIDSIPSYEETESMRERTQDKKLIVVRNKMDETAVSSGKCDPMPPLPWPAIAISAKYAKNIEALEEAIYRSADIPQLTENDVIVTSARHYDALLRAHESLQRVMEGLHTELSGDLLSEDLRICIEELGKITGQQISSTEVLHSIFSHFCIGK